MTNLALIVLAVVTVTNIIPAHVELRPCCHGAAQMLYEEEVPQSTNITQRTTVGWVECTPSSSEIYWKTYEHDGCKVTYGCRSNMIPVCVTNIVGVIERKLK